MDPTEALRQIRSLIRVAEAADDIDLIRKHLKEMRAITDRGITGNIVSISHKR